MHCKAKAVEGLRSGNTPHSCLIMVAEENIASPGFKRRSTALTKARLGKKGEEVEAAATGIKGDKENKIEIGTLLQSSVTGSFK